MRGTKKYKIVKCFRHFGAIIILLWLISIVRFPYSFDKLQVLSNKNFESVSNSVLTLVDCKSTESKSSIDFLLTDGKQYYIITAVIPVLGSAGLTLVPIGFGSVLVFVGFFVVFFHTFTLHLYFFFPILAPPHRGYAAGNRAAGRGISL